MIGMFLQDRDCMMCRVHGDSKPRFLLSPDTIAAAFAPDGEIKALFRQGICPVKELEENGWQVFTVDQQICWLRFALPELLPCLLPSGGTQLLGISGGMWVKANNIIGLHELWVRGRHSGDEMTFGEGYVLIQGEIDALWRAAVREVSSGKPKKCEEWLGLVDEVARRVADRTACQLMTRGMKVIPRSISVGEVAAPSL